MRQGIKPNIVTYNSLISACEKGQSLPKALQLSVDSQRQGIKPNIVTYNSLISACEKGQTLQKALQLLPTFPPPVSLYPTLIPLPSKGGSLSGGTLPPISFHSRSITAITATGPRSVVSVRTALAILCTQIVGDT